MFQGTGAAQGRSTALLEFIPSVPPGAFRLRGVATNLYLAMNDKGRLYGEPDYQDEATMFVQHAHVSTGKRVSRIRGHFLLSDYDNNY